MYCLNKYYVATISIVPNESRKTIFQIDILTEILEWDRIDFV